MKGNRGFTFIEIMAALLIFVLAVVAAVDIVNGSVRATLESKEITLATWLLQNVMVELETKIETEGLDKGCEAKKEAKFSAPYDKYTWTTYCSEIDINLSEAASKLAEEKKSDDNQTNQNLIQKMLLQVSSDYMTRSVRELHAEVSWVQGKNKRQIAATTHFARYDQPISLPQVPGAGGSSSPSPGGGSLSPIPGGR